MNLQDWFEIVLGAVVGLTFAAAMDTRQRSKHQLARLNQMAASINRILTLKTLVFSALNDFEQHVITQTALGHADITPFTKELRGRLLVIFDGIGEITDGRAGAEEDRPDRTDGGKA